MLQTTICCALVSYVHLFVCLFVCLFVRLNVFGLLLAFCMSRSLCLCVCMCVCLCFQSFCLAYFPPFFLLLIDDYLIVPLLEIENSNEMKCKADGVCH